MNKNNCSCSNHNKSPQRQHRHKAIAAIDGTLFGSSALINGVPMEPAVLQHQKLQKEKRERDQKATSVEDTWKRPKHKKSS